MEHYYPYDLFSTERIEETLTVEDGLIQLRHTPKYRSVVIDDFNETDSVSLQANQFRVDYSLDTYYRESNRLLHFNPVNNGRELTISYITCGTVVTADDMNEIKAHLESDHSKYYQLPIATHDIRGGIRVGENLYMTGDILNANVSSGLASLPTASATQLGGIKIGNGLSVSNDGILSANSYTLPTASETLKGGVKIGNGLSMDGDTLNASCEDKSLFKFNAPYAPPEIDIDFLSIPVENNVDINAKTWSTDSTSDESPEISFVAIVGRPAKFGDIIYWTHTSNRNGWAIRVDDKWINLGIDGESDTRWSAINPLLTVEDRKKLDNLPNGLVLGEGLAFDEDGKLCVVKEKNSDGWAYQDSGYDVIPAAPLIYVDDTHFYQPEWNARMNDMFNTAEGVMEFWIRCDLTCSGLAYGDRFGFGYYSKTSGTFVGMMNGDDSSDGNVKAAYYTACFTTAVDGIGDTWGKTGLTFNTNGDNHILFHAVSHPTEGYREVTINYGTYRVSGNVNNGNPFDSFFVYSNSEHALFSNFVVSSTQLEY